MRPALSRLPSPFETSTTRVLVGLAALLGSTAAGAQLPLQVQRASDVPGSRLHGDAVLLAEAFEQGRREHGIEMTIEPLVTLVAAFNQGLIFERLSGIDAGHRELLDWIDAWLEERER